MTKWIAEVADLMDLADWKIIFQDDEEPSEGAAGQIACCYGRKVGTLALSSSLNDPKEAEELRHVLVHELTHCHFHTLDSAVQHDLDGLLTDQAHQVFYLGFQRSLEYAVDAIASSLARYMPLPPTDVFKKSDTV